MAWLFVALTMAAVSGMECASNVNLQEAKASLYKAIINHDIVRNKLSPKAVGDAVPVDYRFKMYEMFRVDEASQTLTSQILFEVRWQDENLAWNIQDFGNLSQMSLPYDKIWAPVIFIGNSAGGIMDNILEGGTLKLHSNGTLEVKSAPNIKVHCNFDLTYYPFDTQTCPIYLSTTGGDERLKARHLLFLEGDIFSINGEWTILNKHAELKTTGLTAGEVIEIKVTIKRESTFYIFSFVVPMMVTSLLALLVFWIPPGSGEKMSYLVNLYVASTLYLSFFSENLPRNISENDKVPTMTVFLLFTIVESVLAMVATIFVLHRYHKQQQQQQDQEVKPTISSDTETIVEDFKTESQDKREKTDSATSKTGKLDTFEEKDDPSLHISTIADILPGRSKSDDPSQEMTRGCLKKEMSAKELDRLFFIIFIAVSVPFYAAVFTV